MGHHPDALEFGQTLLDDHPTGRLGEHHDQRRSSAQCAQSGGLAGRRASQHGMQRDDHRHGELICESENELPVIAAEDAVLVLDQDDIDIALRQFRCCCCVVARNVLSDRRDDLWWVRMRIIPHDGDDLDSERRVGVLKRRPQI